MSDIATLTYLIKKFMDQFWTRTLFFFGACNHFDGFLINGVKILIQERP